MHQVNIHEAKTHFSKLIKEVINGGEVIIAKGNKPIAKLIAIEEHRPQRKLGTAKCKIDIATDFNVSLKDFSEYQ